MVLSRPKRNSSRENSGMQGKTDECANTSAMDLALASLQPLRDLARNWDVDVASCLEEYLQELAGIHPQQLQKLAEGSTTNNTVSNSTNSDENDVPNFAHAALILQNSSNVYSRKVEYLYSLVYKALEEFFQASKANSSNKNGRKNKTVDADIDEFFDFDPHECFLLLDDVVPEDITPSHRKINLKDDDEEEESRDRTSSMGGDEVPGSAKSRNMTRLSLGGLSVTRMERNSTFSNGGISSQQQQRALLGILNNGSLRLMSGHCDVGDNGVLLMPGSQSIRSNLNSQNLDEEIMDNPNNSFHNGLQDTLGSERRNLFDGNENDFDDNDDGPGFVMNDDFIEDGDADMIGTGNDKNGVEGVATLALSQKPPTKSVAFADSVDEEMRKKQQRQKEKKDPWKLLDPHSVGDDLYRPRPLKRGKTYKLPEGILRPPSDCVTGSSTSRTTKPERRSLAPPSLRPSLAVESFRVSMGKQLEASNKVAYRGLAYGEEFMYIAKENAKVKAAKRRKERKRQQEVISSLQREDKQSIGDLNNEGLYDDEDDNGVGIDFGGGDDYYDEGDQDYSAGNSGLVNLDDAFGSGQPNDDDDIQDKGSNYGKSFEDLCRAHIEAFAKGAEKFALTTKLTERISQWQAHLAPILEEEERKASFDIHRYSEMLLESAIETAEDMKRESTGGHPSDDFYKTKNSVDFQSVAHGCTRSDICRLFLASLSLANSGNLKIEEGALDYRFEILSSKVDKPMETYRAPSATTV